MWTTIAIVSAFFIGMLAVCLTKSGDVRHEDDVWDLDPHLFDRRQP